ncbi:hypothetical protein ACGFMM_01160 [Streptomyces sp. NPDC048604]|uniref:hypothetical protein n=1 Tax=Streptomyces sp. NPDC048604 TaxID=3365578 RepID=UPI00371B2DFC
MRRRRPATAVAATAVLALTASGCVTVHGELELVPAVTKAEAEQALKDFTAAYNAADKAYDPALDAGRVTGPLGAINQAGLKARSVTSPGGNPKHQPLELTDAKFVIPKKAGWPRWFVADTDSNRDRGARRAGDRWLLVFVRNGAEQLWEVAHLAILSPDEVPAFEQKDGYAVPVAANDAKLAVSPKDIGGRYVTYLKSGEPKMFAPGPHTTTWRQSRERNAKRLGMATQYVDQTMDDGDNAPLALRTEDGGALVFFAIRFFERQTAARGYRPKVDPDVKALMTGEVTNTVTKEWVSNQAALVKPAAQAASNDAVTIAGRLQGVTAAKGS